MNEPTGECLICRRACEPDVTGSFSGGGFGVCPSCLADAALGRAVRRDDFWELRKVRRVVRYGAIDPLSGVMPALEWADEYMAARHDGAGKVEWESGPTPKAALMAAGLMKGEER